MRRRFRSRLRNAEEVTGAEGQRHRLLFQSVQRLYSADRDRPWGEEAPHSVMVFIGIVLPEEEIRAGFAGLKLGRRKTSSVNPSSGGQK